VHALAGVNGWLNGKAAAINAPEESKAGMSVLALAPSAERANALEVPNTKNDITPALADAAASIEAAVRRSAPTVANGHP
jgi:hypothetical protein